MIPDSGTFVLHIGKLPVIRLQTDNQFIPYIFWYSGPILTTSTTSTTTTKPKTTTENTVDSYGAPASGGIGGGGYYGHPHLGGYKKRNVEVKCLRHVIFDICNDNGDLGLTWDEIEACEVTWLNQWIICIVLLSWLILEWVLSRWNAFSMSKQRRFWSYGQKPGWKPYHWRVLEFYWSQMILYFDQTYRKYIWP